MDVFTELPLNYEIDYVLDAKNKKTGIIFNIAAIGIMAVTFMITMMIKMWDNGEFTLDFSVLETFVLLAGLLSYTVLHELVHGIFYKIFTKNKMKKSEKRSFLHALCVVMLKFVEPKLAKVKPAIDGMIKKVKDSKVVKAVSKFFGKAVDFVKTRMSKFNPDLAPAKENLAETFNNFVH